MIWGIARPEKYRNEIASNKKWHDYHSIASIYLHGELDFLPGFLHSMWQGVEIDICTD